MKRNPALLLVVAALSFLVLAEGCSALLNPSTPKAACALLDTACSFVTVRYTDENGVVREESVPASLIMQTTKAHMAGKKATP